MRLESDLQCIACVVDTGDETVATSAQHNNGNIDIGGVMYYVNLEKDPSPESTKPVRA
jgi:hypothetical protein